MKVDEVPQDNGSLNKAMYALDRHGHYTTVESTGWQVESIATEVAIADFERDLAAAYERCAAGASAALEYHMYARRMDVPALADATGIARWRVRRHLRPRVFARLPQRLLVRYAQALQLPVAVLSQLPAAPSQ